MQSGLISKIQRYATKDGPGLRTTVFLMGCNLRCKWCANPETLKQTPRVYYYKERCRQCGICVAHAHHNSITLDETGCKIDRQRCDNLLEMVDLCPYDAYEKVGVVMTSQELANQLLKDREFYIMGHGGVTFSGGEAALQADFVCETAALLRKEGIHVCLDTAGLVSEEVMLKILKHIDMVLYDIKAIDESVHQYCTGVSNYQILNNAKIIAQSGIPMIIRMVVVWQHNDNLDDLKKRIDFVAQLGSSVVQVDILKYHIYGIGKYEKLGEAYLIETPEIVEEKIDFIYNYALNKGLKVTIGG